MLYLVLQMCLVLKLWLTVFWGEYVYKKIPGNPDTQLRGRQFQHLATISQFP